MANWQGGFWKLWLATSLVVSGTGNYALAQIVPDGTLDNESSVVIPDATVRDRAAELIEGGAIRNINLFHSFLEFNVNEGQRVYFANPVGIENILTRVTGSNASEIWGTLGVDGAANLFLLNPNGIIFGEGAELDIGGSFVGSTADSIVFGDEEFSASEPEAAPLLKINVPIGLQYGPNQPAPVVNAGTLEVGQGQGLTLTGGTVVNTDTGQLMAPGGSISLTAVHSESVINLDMTGQVSSVDLPDDTTQVESSAPALAALLEGAGLAEAGIPTDFQVGTVAILGSVDASDSLGSGGEVTLAGNRIRLLEGVVKAGGITGGEINLTSTLLENRGEIRADGEYGGSLTINTTNLLDAGVLSATGSAGDGGRIEVEYEGTVIQTASALTSVTGSEAGGRIEFQGGRVLTTSGNLEAKGELGGEIHLFGERLQLLATEVNASGNSGGGEILVGGDYQGNTVGAENALKTFVNHATTLQADGLQDGDGGRIIVWAEQETDFYGSLMARGGELGGNGGLLEVSGKGSLVFGGLGDASAANGVAGELLLDPKNIAIAAPTDPNNTGTFIPLLDPNPALDNQFGNRTAVLTNDNIVVTSPGDSLTALGAGAVYLFDSKTGAVLGSINGANFGDALGFDSFSGLPSAITALSNGNYVFGNPSVDIGGVEDAGTVILADGTTGREISRISGINPFDLFGNSEITALNNSNYVFGNPDADIPGLEDAGTVILADGTTGREINRISGANENDAFGSGEITALSNGNYVFGNLFADIGGVVNAGTVILADGTTGREINRISGANPLDNFGSGEITALSNGNYVFGNPGADIGGAQNGGTVILADGTTGREINRISGANRLEQFGSGEITALSNGNYVFGNPAANIGGIEVAGTVILADGTTGREINRISGANRLEQFGSGEITALSNGNYVFGNPSANIVGVQNAGTVILADGITGREINRISGANPFDMFGSDVITTLSNGNYVFGNSFADIRGVQNAGTVILADGITGTEINRISGATPFDQFGNGEITALSNGNYVFGNRNATIGGVRNAGTVILADGTTGREIHRISGIDGSDQFGEREIRALSNGNYLFSEPFIKDNAGLAEIGIANPNSLAYGYFPDRNITLTPATITTITNTGTAVKLQANNDITVNQAIITDNATGSGGSLSLEAGRSIVLNADITTDNGNLSLLANQPLASGVIDSERDPGAAEITMAAGTSINAGFGDVTIELDTGEGLTNNTIGNVTLNNINAENLNVHSEGAILGNGILTINRDASFTSNLANAGSVSVTNTNPTTVGYSIIGGNFSLNSPLPISHAPGYPLQVAGTISVNGGGNLSLVNTIGLPTPLTTLPNGDVLVIEVGTVDLPARTVTGNLIVNSLPEAVLAFNSVNNTLAITLNQANSFGGTVSFNTTTDAIFVEGIPGITQSGSQLVSGSATFNANGGNISLTNPANQFGSLAFAGDEVSLQEADAINLLTSTATGNLNLTSGGTITQTGALNIAGDASFTTTTPNAGNVTLINKNATILGRSLIGGNFTIDSGGLISQALGEPLQVAGDTTILNPAGNPDLDTSGNTLPRLNLPNGDVIITEVGTINLDGETFTGNLTVNSLARAVQFIPGVIYNSPAITLNQAGNSFGSTVRISTDAPTTLVEQGTPGITQSGSLAVSGTATFNAENANITLNETDNQFGNLAFNGKDISISENNATNLLSSTATGNLSLTSRGAITQSETLNVTGTSNFSSLEPNAPIILTGQNQLNGTISLAPSGTGNVTLFNTLTTTQLAPSNISGNLTITSGGGITQTGGLNIAGITTLNAGNSDINLNQNNDFSRVIMNGGRNFTLNDINNIELGNSSVSGNLRVNATGDITTQDIVNPSGSIILTSTNGTIDTTPGTLSTLDFGTGGAITLSADGDITLGSVNSRGGFIAGGDITLLSNGKVSAANSFISSETFGTGKAGDINIQAQSISFINETKVLAATNGSGQGGNVNLNVSDSVELRNGSSLSSETFGSGTAAGDINIQAQSVLFTDNTAASAASLGLGQGGNINFNVSGSVELRNSSFLTSLTIGLGKAGNINIQAQSVLFTDETVVSAFTLGSGQGGNINFNVSDSVELRNDSSLSSETFGSGKAGDINIQAQSVLFTDNTAASASTFGSGQGGNVNFNVSDSVELRNGSFLGTVTRGAGNSGELTINTGRLIIKNEQPASMAETTVSTVTLPGSSGQGGNLTVNATESVEIIGNQPGSFTPDLTQPRIVLDIATTPTDITTATFGSGNAGTLTVNTERLIIRDGATITTSSIGLLGDAGNGGELRVNATSIELQGKAGLATSTLLSSGNAGNLIVEAEQITLRDGALISSDTVGSGRAGDLRITTNQLNILDGSRVGAATVASGAGRTVRITASDKIELAGTSADGQVPSGIFANSTGRGPTGNLELNTGELIVRDGAKVTVSSTGSAEQAGNLNIYAGSILLSNQGILEAITTSGNGGNITLRLLGSLILRHGSQITTTAGTAQAGGDGGNIIIDNSNGFIIGVPNENSDITANAFRGNGGRINITTQGIFGLEFRDEPTDFSDITASSEFGLNGTVEINQLNIDPSQGLSNLPDEPGTPKPLQGCRGGGIQSGGQFISIGKQGIPTNPYESLDSSDVWEDLQPAQELAENPTEPPEQIVEATGWVVTEEGEVILVAKMPSAASRVGCLREESLGRLSGERDRN